MLPNARKKPSANVVDWETYIRATQGTNFKGEVMKIKVGRKDNTSNFKNDQSVGVKPIAMKMKATSTEGRPKGAGKKSRKRG